MFFILRYIQSVAKYIMYPAAARVVGAKFMHPNTTTIMCPAAARIVGAKFFRV